MIDFDRDPMNWICPLCKSKEINNIEKHNSNTAIFKKTKLFTCKKCSLKSVYPLPSESDLNNFNRTYWNQTQDKNTDLLSFYYDQAFWRIDYIRKHLGSLLKMKMLDVGAGHGYIYDILAKENNTVDYYAVESDHDLLKQLKNKRIKNTYSSYDTIDEFDFDIIILSHILEHLTTPFETLKKLKLHLKSSGYMFAEVPNRDDFFKLDLGPHLLVFNQNALKFLFKQLDMSIIDTVTVGENIDNLRPSRFIRLLRRSLPQWKIISYFSTITMGKVNYRKKDMHSMYKCNEYNENGRWTRVLCKNT